MAQGLDVAMAIVEAVSRSKLAHERLNVTETSKAIRKLHKGSGYSEAEIAHVLEEESAAVGMDAPAKRSLSGGV